MSQRRVLSGVAVALVAAASIAGCGGSDSSSSPAGSAVASETVVAVGDAPLPGDGVGSLGDAVAVVAAAPGQADAVACDVDRTTMQTATDAYEVLNGALPTSEDDLVTGQLIREPSPRFDITADGLIVPAPGGPCV